MSDNLAQLIDHVITMSDELNLNLITDFQYTKDTIRFRFTKCDRSISWSFSIVEIEDIADINILRKN